MEEYAVGLCAGETMGQLRHKAYRPYWNEGILKLVSTPLGVNLRRRPFHGLLCRTVVGGRSLIIMLSIYLGLTAVGVVVLRACAPGRSKKNGTWAVGCERGGMSPGSTNERWVRCVREGTSCVRSRAPASEPRCRAFVPMCAPPAGRRASSTNQPAGLRSSQSPRPTVLSWLKTWAP